MSAEAIGTLIGAGIAFLALLGSVMTVVFLMGALRGQISTFMVTAERDRTDMLKDIGRLGERFERHLEGHDTSIRGRQP